MCLVSNSFLSFYKTLKVFQTHTMCLVLTRHNAEILIKAIYWFKIHIFMQIKITFSKAVLFPSYNRTDSHLSFCSSSLRQLSFSNYISLQNIHCCFKNCRRSLVFVILPLELFEAKHIYYSFTFWCKLLDFFSLSYLCHITRSLNLTSWGEQTVTDVISMSVCL